MCVCVLFFGSLPLDTRGASGSSKPLDEAVMASVLCVSAYCLLFVCVLKRERGVWASVSGYAGFRLQLARAGVQLTTMYSFIILNTVCPPSYYYMCVLCVVLRSLSLSLFVRMCVDLHVCLALSVCLRVCVQGAR